MLREEQEQLPRPNVLNRATLEAIEDKDLDYALSWYVVEQYKDNLSKTEEIILNLPSGLRNHYLSWLLEAEIMNGGLNQYFWNVSPSLIQRTPEALREIGATEAAKLLEAAIAQGAEESQMRERFKASPSLVEGFSESYKYSKLEQFDEKYMELSDRVMEKRIAYVRGHYELFLTENQNDANQ